MATEKEKEKETEFFLENEDEDYYGSEENDIEVNKSIGVENQSSSSSIVDDDCESFSSRQWPQSYKYVILSSFFLIVILSQNLHN